MKTLKVSEIHQHPLNKEIYNEIDKESPSYQDMLRSIRENGIIEPLVVRSTGLLLSGHRRLSVAESIGLEEVPVIVKEDGDDRELLIEYNRYRVKTASEIMREAEIIETILLERAKANMRRGPIALSDDESPVHVRREVATAVGMGERTYGKLKTVFELAKVNPNIAEKMGRIDSGSMSIDAAFRAARSLIKDESPEERPEIPDFIKFYNSWQFSENDPRFGIPHPGRIPGQIPANIIYYFTEPGDLVVDPMAGGGSTIDAAEYLGRKCLAYDIAPRRPDIIQHDISEGFPVEAKDCQLIFMDPPYWNAIAEKYVKESASSKSLYEFCQWYNKLLSSAAHTVCRGGFVAVINMAQYFRLPPDYKDGYIDWPMQTYDILKSCELTPWTRIGVTYPPTNFTGFDVESAKEGKHMLPIHGDIIVMRRLP